MPVRVSSLRALWWARSASRQTRRDLARRGLEELVVVPPPSLPSADRRWVVALLKASRQTCLVRSAVLQAWDAAHGRRRDLIIGVTPPREGFKAHAWLEGEPASASRGFTELSRRPAPGRLEHRAGPGEVSGTNRSGEGSGGGDGDQTLEEQRQVGPVP